MREMASTNMTDAVDSIMRQLRRYQTACMQEGNHYRAAEWTINKKLAPLMEELLIEDVRKGEQHMITPTGFPDAPILITDMGAVYGQATLNRCRGTDVASQLQKINKLPLRDVGSMIEEGNLLIDMVDYFEKVNAQTKPSAFLERYRVPPNFQKTEEFVNGLVEISGADNCKNEIVNAKSIKGELVFEKDAFADIYKFLRANQDELIAVSYDGGKLMVGSGEGKTPVYGASLKYRAKRDDFESDFVVSNLSVELYLSQLPDGKPNMYAGEPAYKFKFHIEENDERFSFLGDLITDELFEKDAQYLLTNTLFVSKEVAEENAAFLKMREEKGKNITNEGVGKND